MKLRLAAVSLTVLSLASCSVLDGADDTGDKKPAMNMQQAAERADQIISDTLGAVQPAVQWTHGEPTAGSCSATRRAVVMTVITDQRRGNFLGIVERHWTKKGHRDHQRP